MTVHNSFGTKPQGFGTKVGASLSDIEVTAANGVTKISVGQIESINVSVMEKEGPRNVDIKSKASIGKFLPPGMIEKDESSVEIQERKGKQQKKEQLSRFYPPEMMEEKRKIRALPMVRKPARSFSSRAGTPGMVLAQEKTPIYATPDMSIAIPQTSIYATPKMELVPQKQVKAIFVGQGKGVSGLSGLGSEIEDLVRKEMFGTITEEELARLAILEKAEAGETAKAEEESGWSWSSFLEGATNLIKPLSSAATNIFGSYLQLNQQKADIQISEQLATQRAAAAAQQLDIDKRLAELKIQAAATQMAAFGTPSSSASAPAAAAKIDIQKWILPGVLLLGGYMLVKKL